MRIKLFFIHPKNYGNMMMADSFIYYFTQFVSKTKETDITFYLDVVDDEELRIVKKNLPSDISIKSDILYDQKKQGILGKIEKLFFVPIEIRHNIKKFDASVILGGDCISEYYSKQKFVFNMIKFHFISKKIPMFALGQTMGPFSLRSIKFVRWALENCKIYARDDDGYRYLIEKVGLHNVKKARDLALLNIPFQYDEKIIKNTIKRYIGKMDCKYITYVPSGANLQYTSDTVHYIEEFVRMIMNSIDKYSVDILLLAHVIHTKTSNDKAIIDKIMQLIPKQYKKRINCINYLILPYESRILLGNGLFTITGRMHAAVSSINMGVVPICLSYSVKYKGVIGDPYDLNEYIIQCRGNDKWVGHEISDKVALLQEKLITENEKNRRRIVERNEENSKIALSQIEETANMMIGWKK